MKAPLLILFIAGASLSLALRTVITRGVINEERIVALELQIKEILKDPLDSARGLLGRMQAASRRSAEKMAGEVSLIRPYGIQMRLLKEDLEWLNRGYTPRQITIVQVVVLGGALERAAEAADNPTDEQQKHITKIWIFKEAGMNLLKKKLRELGEVKDREMRFHL